MKESAKKIRAAVVPKNAKELADWMMQDAELRRRITDIVVEADLMIEKEITSAFSKFLRDRGIDLRMMNHDDATEALNRFYRSARLAGRYVRMW